MVIRKELGGWAPKDPLKFEFIYTVLASNLNKNKEINNKQHLQNLILKNR